MVKNSIDINCDLGEGFNNEAEIMPFIQSCNIACGGHAGNTESMTEVVKLALKHKVKIGAHPSYPDKENFGRKSMKLDEINFIYSIQNQVNSLLKIVVNLGGSLYHIKPHGALYNDVFKNKELAQLLLTALNPYKNDVKLVVPFNSEIEKLALTNDFKIIYEAFADRRYNSDLSLVSRDKKNAVLTNLEEIKTQIEQINFSQQVTTIDGSFIPIKASTYCVHSDTVNATKIIKYLSLNLKTK